MLIRQKGKLSRKAMVGYPTGIISGIAYGLNPLFAKPLISHGVAIENILFFRYGIAVALLAVLLKLRGMKFSVTASQAAVLLVLGLLYTASSLLLFEAYLYIPSGLATTLVFMTPVIVALIMVFLKVVPSWPVWLSIATAFGGVMLMTRSDGAQTIDPTGVALALGSALAYAFFIVIVNKNKTVGEVDSTMLTFYALLVGTVVFLLQAMRQDHSLLYAIDGFQSYVCLIGLALLPTILSMTTLAISSRNIGATKASVLSVFEPITAIIVGTMFMGEALTANIVIGIAIAIAGVTFMIIVTKR
ncbi:MAG: EamA family transporter [Fibrobacter sp.]|nr:EamA family transporter [Fibrobacter sp.]